MRWLAPHVTFEMPRRSGRFPSAIWSEIAAALWKRHRGAGSPRRRYRYHQPTGLQPGVPGSDQDDHPIISSIRAAERYIFPQSELRKYFVWQSNNSYLNFQHHQIIPDIRNMLQIRVFRNANRYIYSSLTHHGQNR
jgi:hypothetical protein